MNEKIDKLMTESVVTRWTALGLVSLTMLAAYYFVDMIAPLQSLIEKGYNWKPDVYGFFSGSEYMLNVFGFLLLSGIILDKMGIRFTGIMSAGVMLLGGAIKLYGLSEYFNTGGFGYELMNSFWQSMPPSAKVASLGFAIFGIGVEMAGITTSKTVVKWFKGKELAFAMGMQMATARLGASVAFFFSAVFAGAESSNPNPLNSIYVGLALLSIGLLTYIIYSTMDRKLDKQRQTQDEHDPTEEFHLKDLGKLIINPGVIIISLLCVLFYCGVFPFLKYAVNMMQNKLNIDAGVGGMISGLLPFGTIFITPIIGNYLDKKGKGATMMIFGSALLTLAHLTFAIVPLNMALAILAIVVLGIAFSLIPASMWPSVPKIVEEKYLGSAFALVFWIQNIGLMIIPWLIGVVLDAVNPGVAESIQAGDLTAVYDYTYPMLIFASLGFAAVLLAFALKAVDAKKGYGLELPNKK